MQKNKLVLTNTHNVYAQALHDRDMKPVIAYGSAGTGKTYGAVEAALKQLENRQVQQIIVTRPNVSFAEKSGFLPGTEREKMEPWVRPILQNMMKCGYNASKIQAMEKAGQLVFYPLEHIQGLTFDNAFIIVDEVQNVSYDQLKVFLTRTGVWSRVVLAGDIAQISPRFNNSGLAQLLKMIKTMNVNVHTIEFLRNDILRSGQCKQWITDFEDFEAGIRPCDYLAEA